MKPQSPFAMNQGARMMIFSGVPVGVLAVFDLLQYFYRFINDNIWIYVFWAAMIVVVVLGMVTYNVFPKRLVLPLGIIGWIASFSILWWIVSVGVSARSDW